MDQLSEKPPDNGPIATAAQQFEDAVTLRKLDKVPRQHLNRAIAITDSLLGTLERLNLKGRVPAPAALESGISAMLQAIPAQFGVTMGRARSTRKVMDELFRVQQRLLAMRAGPEWEWAYIDEESEPRKQRSRPIENLLLRPRS